MRTRNIPNRFRCERSKVEWRQFATIVREKLPVDDSRLQVIDLPSALLKFAGDFTARVTPVPIPNTEVKPRWADGTARVSVWEIR